jgi:hypothetical protein
MDAGAPGALAEGAASCRLLEGLPAEHPTQLDRAVERLAPDGEP